MYSPITQSKNYLKELKDFTEAVESITDSTSKTKAKRLLDEFKTQAKFIDNQYNSLLDGARSSANPKEFVAKLTEARKKLYKIIEDLKS